MTDVPGHPTFAAQEGKRNLLVESMYEYGSRAGIWRILRLFKQYDVKSTVFAIGMALERNPAAAKAMAQRRALEQAQAPVQAQHRMVPAGHR